MQTQIYDAFGIGLAVLIGLIFFAGVIKESLRNRNFARDNLKWLAYIVLWAVTSPLFFCWASPTKILLADAFLLRVTTAGWTYVLMSYAALIGLLLGWALAAVIRRFQNV